MDVANGILAESEKEGPDGFTLSWIGGGNGPGGEGFSWR